MLRAHMQQSKTDYVLQRLKCTHADGTEYKAGAWLYKQFQYWDELTDDQRAQLAPFTRNRSRVDLPLWDLTIRALDLYGRQHEGVVDPPSREIIDIEGRPLRIGDFAQPVRRTASSSRTPSQGAVCCSAPLAPVLRCWSTTAGSCPVFLAISGLADFPLTAQFPREDWLFEMIW